MVEDLELSAANQLHFGDPSEVRHHPSVQLDHLVILSSSSRGSMKFIGWNCQGMGKYLSSSNKMEYLARLMASSGAVSFISNIRNSRYSLSHLNNRACGKIVDSAVPSGPSAKVLYFSCYKGRTVNAANQTGHFLPARAWLRSMRATKHARTLLVLQEWPTNNMHEKTPHDRYRCIDRREQGC